MRKLELPDWIKKRLPQLSPVDRQILDSTGQMIDQLGLRVVQPAEVAWTSHLRVGAKGATVFIPPAFPRVEGIGLAISPELKDRLTADDLKPLIASSLIFYRGSVASSRLRKAFRLFLPLLLLFLATEASLFLFNPVIGAVAIIPFTLILTIVGKVAFAPTSRRAWLAADKQAAGLVGLANFVETLNKMSTLGLADKEGRSTPRISDRIQNLQSWDPVQQ